MLAFKSQKNYMMQENDLIGLRTGALGEDGR